jgi:tetrahydromethanopterin S-methyltransferase subunit A
MSNGPVVEEEPTEEEPKEMQAGPMVRTESPQEEPEETTTEEPVKVTEEKNEESEEKESASKTTTASVVSSKKNIKQKKVQSKKSINSKLEKVMTKIDEEIKDSAKNLQLKNLIKMDVMIGEQMSLALYENVEFYKPRVMYLDQLDIQDNRQIYANISLATYTNKDIIGVKQKRLQILDDEKQKLLIELEVLKNG